MISNRWLISILFLFAATNAYAIPRSNYAGVDWFTTETDHFIIHYHRGVEESTAEIRVAAEAAYQAVTKIYDFTPKDKTHIVVRDLEDTANGSAVWHLDWITLWTSNTLFPLRGRHDWIYGRLFHEFSHIVSLQRSAIFGKLIEGIRFGGLEDDATQAHFDIGFSAFLSANLAPRWWAEAIAQLDTAMAGYDPWDSSQEMLLRAAILEDNLLNFDELHNIRVREHFGPELVYNQGFSFVSYLDKRFGNVNRKLAEHQKKHKHLDFEKNFAELFGQPAKMLYQDWKAEMKGRYQEQIKEIVGHEVAGQKIKLLPEDPHPGELAPNQRNNDRLYQDGIWNFYPRFSPDGHTFSYVANNRVVLKHLTKPYDLAEVEGTGIGAMKTLEPPELNDPNHHESFESGSIRFDAGSETMALKGRGYSWGPSSDRLIVSRRVNELTGGYAYYDLYLIDLKNRQHPNIQRLSHGLRAITPAWSPNGRELAYARNSDGTLKIEIARLVDKAGNQLSLEPAHLEINHGRFSQALDPTWSPDGKKLAYYLLVKGEKRGGLWLYDLTTQRSTRLTPSDADYRDPSFSADGNRLLFSADRRGIFQLFELNLATKKLKQLTRVTTGAFYPFQANNQTDLLYSHFTSYGFKLFHLDPKQADKLPTEAIAFGTVQAVTPTAEKPADFPSHPYRFPLRPPRLFPTLIYEDRQFKAGASMQLADYLEKHQLFAAAVFGKDQDATVSYLNRQWPLDISLQYTRFIRNSDDVQLINDGDGLNDEPFSKFGFDLQYVTAGLEKQFYPVDFFIGEHRLQVSYNWRWVERDFGIPLELTAGDPDTLATSINLIQNHDISGQWRYLYFDDEFNPRNDINPRDGRQMRFEYSHVWTELGLVDTTLSPPTNDYQFERFTFRYAEYLPVPKTDDHTLELKFLAGFITEDVNVNDEFFAGGQLSFRAFGDINSNTNFSGYDAFSLHGETLLLFGAAYRLPLLKNLDNKVGVLYFDSLYGSIFTEIGNAWLYGETEDAFGNTLLEDIGLELRLKAFLFNDFNPWNSFVRVAYGFQDDADHGFRDDDWPVRVFMGLGTDF